MRADFTPPPDHPATFSGIISPQFHNDSFPALSTSDSMTNPASGLWDLAPDSIDSNDNIGQKDSEGSPYTSDSSLHQLLRLQSRLYQITSLVSDKSPTSYISCEDHIITPASSLPLGKTGMPSLDMILRCSQTLIDIVQSSRSSSSPVIQSCSSSTQTLHSQPYSCSINNSASPSVRTSSNIGDIVTTLLSLSCYSSLLVAYDCLVKSLVSPSNSSSDRSTTQVTSSSPSLRFGTFSMAATSTIFVSTVLHVVKEMLEQLQHTFRVNFDSPSNARSEATTPLGSGAGLYPASQNIEGCTSTGLNRTAISAGHAVLGEIVEMERQLMGVLATK